MNIVHDEHLKATEIITFLVRRGYTVDFDRHARLIDIAPPPPPELAARIVANEAILETLLRSLERRPACAHRFVAPFWSKREQFREYGVCLACGVPWAAHGEPAIEHWQTVERVNDVKAIDASALPTACACGVAVS